LHVHDRPLLISNVGEKSGQGRMKQQISLFVPIFGGLTMKHLTAPTKERVLLAIILSLLFVPSSLAEDSFFDSDGVKIHYVVEGKGEPVLMIHPFSMSVQEISSAIKDLSNNFQVIAMDNRGHGQSDKPHDPDAYGTNMIEDYIRILDHLKIKKAHVAGYSMGGRIALAIVCSHPERVLSAIVGGGGWIPQGQEEEFAFGFERKDVESLEQGNIPPSIRKFPWTDPLALAALLRNFRLMPTEIQIRTNKIPVLALIGEKDPGKEEVDRLNGLMPNLKIVVIPNANHLTAPLDPLFIKSFKDFIVGNSKLTQGS
jgi:pimeloyl-ACP methyl ester carboxylesterase